MFELLILLILPGEISPEKLGAKSEEIVVASTGVIGVELPMALIRDQILH